MRLLIVEGNTPDMVDNAQSASASFVRSFQKIAPQAQIEIVNPYHSTDVSLEGIDGAVFTGSGVAWSTDDPRAAPQRTVMEAVFARSIPTWGSCNGMQLAASVLGGTVGASPVGLEIGVARDTRRAGAPHPMFDGRAERWAVPCIHRDEVQRLPEGAVLTASNAHSPIQGFAYETQGVDFWGTQYHPELTLKDIAAYIEAPNSVFAQDEGLTQDLHAAEHDEAAASRLGTTIAEAAFETRARELFNWVAHVERRMTH